MSRGILNPGQYFPKRSEYQRMLAILTNHGPMTRHDIAAVGVHISPGALKRWLDYAIRPDVGHAHIKDWPERQIQGPRMPRYVAGPGVNAVKPKPFDDRHARWTELRRKHRKNDPERAVKERSQCLAARARRLGPTAVAKADPLLAALMGGGTNSSTD